MGCRCITALVGLFAASTGCSFEGQPASLTDAAVAIDAPSAPCLTDSRYATDPATGLRLRHEDTERLDWASAAAVCELEGAHHVALTDEARRLYVANLDVGNDTWIGLRAESLTVWRWVTGEQLDAVVGQPPFADNRPDLGPPQQSCARIRDDGLYDDESCDNQRPFLCQCEVGSATEARQR